MCYYNTKNYAETQWKLPSVRAQKIVILVAIGIMVISVGILGGLRWLVCCRHHGNHDYRVCPAQERNCLTSRRIFFN